jgi:hypothetical protein
LVQTALERKPNLSRRETPDELENALELRHRLHERDTDAGKHTARE